MKIKFDRASKIYLNLNKIKTCHPEAINKDYDAEKIEKKLLKEIMHNYFELSEFELSEFKLLCTQVK